MGRAKEGVDWCKYCDVYPRNPCHSKEEAYDCGNCPEYTKRSIRMSMPGYSQDEADELTEYRRRYGRLK